MQKYGIFVLQAFFCTINFTLSGILNIDAVAVDGILYVGFFIGEILVCKGWKKKKFFIALP